MSEKVSRPLKFLGGHIYTYIYYIHINGPQPQSHNPCSRGNDTNSAITLAAAAIWWIHLRKWNSNEPCSREICSISDSCEHGEDIVSFTIAMGESQKEHPHDIYIVLRLLEKWFPLQGERANSLFLKTQISIQIKSESNPSFFCSSFFLCLQGPT